jgi:hypothetical protein
VKTIQSVFYKWTWWFPDGKPVISKENTLVE